MKKEKSFEANLKRLEEIVSLLERGDAPLQDTLSLFAEGTKLAAACTALLNEAQQQVAALQKGEDGKPLELPFATEE